MRLLPLDEVARAAGCMLRAPGHGIRVAAVTVDSRRLTPPHALFFALAGRQTDGHRFVAEALSGGCVAAVVDAEHADTLLLSWSPPCNEAGVPGQDFGIYQGTLSAPFDDHEALTCTTDHDPVFMLPAMPSGSVFFVVVPSTGEGEGGYGSVDPAQLPCKPQNSGSCD